ncbi:protein phosphatase 1 regulatory subunit 3G [Synchiropus splendidus]|uniref:protein phosphatase 1 regulatory subunit 3G n=1 Tax=Synchiropus splendidus TaxID=270530 RepID=UPI00237EBBBC|nr:protein phosphatase 1 regulatory subunit 3G [Synchiropus splendidus]
MSQPEEELDDEADASRLERYMRERRRARSLPAYPAALLGGTEGEGRKRVKFADSMGLNLASVKHFSALEEPRIPSKVLSRHKSFPPQQQQQEPPEPERRVACAPELADAEQRLRRLRVCLEEVSISRLDVRGLIRVLSEAARGLREVGVRYTFNEWLSHVDAPAAPQPGSAGLRFCFTVYTPPLTEPSATVHLAVYLRSDDGEFWDNNAGRNYTLRYCAPPSEAAFHAT